MSEYQAVCDNSLSLQLMQGETQIGKLSYKSWFKFNALIELRNRTYEVAPKGFCGTTIELKENDNLLLKFKMNWHGEIVIQAYLNGIEKGYIFKHRGLFKESFILTDQDGTELLMMKPQLKWSKLRYEYLITTADDFDFVQIKEVLLMTSLHCANYYMSMIANVS